MLLILLLLNIPVALFTAGWLPLSAGERYKTSLPNSRLEVIDGAGHLVEYEEPARLASLIASHATQSA